jgi:hypothetical protein
VGAHYEIVKSYLPGSSVDSHFTVPLWMSSCNIVYTKRGDFRTVIRFSMFCLYGAAEMPEAKVKVYHSSLLHYLHTGS